MPPLLPRRSAAISSAVSPRRRSSVVGVGDGRVAALVRRRSVLGAREHRADLAERAVRRVRRVDERAARARTAASSTSSGTDSTGATQVSAGAELARPTRRGRVVANAAREVGADLVLHGVVESGASIHCSQPSARQRLRAEARLDRGDRQPPAVGAAVDVVAGVAAGEDVVARARAPRRSRGTRRRRAPSARARRRPPTRRGTRPRPSRARRTSAARIAITACIPPPALSATVAPGSGGPPSAPRPRAVEVAADREVVEVVAGPLRVRAGLAVAARRAVDDARGSRARDVRRSRCRARSTTPGRKLSITTSARAASRRNASRPGVGLEVEQHALHAAVRRCTRRTAARSARRRASAAAPTFTTVGAVVGQPARRARRRARPARSSTVMPSSSAVDRHGVRSSSGGRGRGGR